MKIQKIFIITLVALCLWGVFGTTAMAAGTDPSTGGLVQCGKTGSAQDQATSCNFAALINLVNRGIQYLIYISLPLAAIAFAWAGWIYLSAGGDTGKVKKAHTIFLDVGIGIALVLTAWLIFQYIAKEFLSDTYVNSTYLK